MVSGWKCDFVGKVARAGTRARLRWNRTIVELSKSRNCSSLLSNS